MLNRLKKSERERVLNDSENRSIIRACTDAEVERLDKAVFSSLGKRYSSLNGIFGEMRKGFDPVERMAEAESQIKVLGVAKGLVDLLDLVDGDEDTHAVKTMLDKFDPFIELYKEFAPIQEQFYVDLVYAVREVSTQRRIGVEITVRDLQYMDEVSRIVIPTREGAESFLRTSQTYGKEMLDIGRGFIAFAKKTGQADEDSLERAKLMPTVRAMEVIQKGIWDYKMQEFDRIYSVKE